MEYPARIGKRSPQQATRRALDTAACTWSLIVVACATVGLGAAHSAGSTTAPEPASHAGARAYADQCASCHGATRSGGFGPPVSGSAFKAKWEGSPEKLLAYISKFMPPSEPGSLKPSEYQAVTDFLLQDDAAQPKAAADAAPTGEAAPERRQFATGIDANLDATAIAVEKERREHLADLRPVTASLAAQPDAADWLHWRNGYSSLGFSPLDQINTTNVGKLSLIWSLALPPGTNEIAPLVHDGVIFLNSAGNVQAIDGPTGDVLWEFARPTKPWQVPVSQPRSMALYGSSLFVPTEDGHMLALDMRTGNKLWDTMIDSGGKEPIQLTGGPIAARGVVMQGAAGCSGVRGVSLAGGCFIIGLDAVTGKEIWRFKTLAREAEIGGDSWGGAPTSDRHGGSVWIAGSYDPDTNLAYFGVGQTYHVASLLGPGTQSSEKTAALYTDSTVALDPATGKLIWHYQHLSRDVWDMDWTFERQIFTLPGMGDKVMATMGKLGILDVLDARTGKYLFSRDVGLQDLVEKIDPVTGQKVTRKDAEPEEGKTRLICPDSGGVRNWPATAYDPAHATLFIPMVIACMHYSWRSGVPGGQPDFSFQSVPRADSAEKFGRLTAIDVASGELLWAIPWRTPASSAVLATAGGIVLSGRADRYFEARDSRNGSLLWRTRLNGVASSFPVTFGARGRQYIAVTAGGGGPRDAAWRPLTPEVRSPPAQTTLWVFALPQ